MGGVLLSKWGRYKPLHLIGWAIMTLACGLFSLLDSSSSVAAFVCFQLILAVGTGLLAVILLPAMQAPLEESLVALTTGIWTFARLFGGIWGVAIPSVIFNNECRNNAERLVSDPEIVQLLTGGRAYDHATQAFLKSIEDPTVRAQVVEVFSEVCNPPPGFGMQLLTMHRASVYASCVVRCHRFRRPGVSGDIHRERGQAARRTQHRVRAGREKEGLTGGANSHQCVIETLGAKARSCDISKTSIEPYLINIRSLLI